MEKKTLKASTYHTTRMLVRIGSREARKAQEENRRRGIPNAYCFRGQLIFELPSGEITTDDPFNEVTGDVSAPEAS